jgi:hypothetical protein
MADLYQQTETEISKLFVTLEVQSSAACDVIPQHITDMNTNVGEKAGQNPRVAAPIEEECRGGHHL